ncbi:MAG: Uma2 family endonuclease [Dehalococcoidia bacterium]
MATALRLMSLAEFHALPEEKPWRELIDEEVCRKALRTEPDSRASWNLSTVPVRDPRTADGQGYHELGFDFPGPLRDNHRVPDLSFYMPGRAKQQGPYPSEMPDMVAEIRSEGQTMDLQRGRLAFLRDRGVPCTLLIDPLSGSIEVHDSGRVQSASGDDPIVLATLGGFTFTASAIFAE